MTVLAVAALLAYKRPLMSWELSIFTHINNLPESWHTVFLVITALGSTWMAAASVAATFLLKLYWLTWRLAVSVLAGYSVAYVLKTGIGRPRPENLYPEVHIRVAEELAGFPSAHAMLVTIIVMTVLPFLPKLWGWIAGGLLVAAVCASRIYLGVHAPLDIIGGVAIGVTVVYAIRLLPQKIRNLFRLGG